MEGTTTAAVVTGEQIFDQVHDLLNTIPPDDNLASLAGSMIRFIDLYNGPRVTEPVLCEICGQPASVEGVWQTIPVPKPSARYVCDDHADAIVGSDLTYDV